MKKIVLSVLTLVGIMFLGACNLNIGESDLPREDIEITHTVTIDGVRTEVTETFTTNPRVVATFALEFSDIMLELGLNKAGITVFGLSKGENLTESLAEFSGNKYPNVGTLFEPNHDALTLMMPDLIILGGRAASQYSDLKQRYPNADILDISNANPYYFEKQKEIYQNLGKIFTNIKDDLNQYITSFETSFNEIKTNFPDKNVLFLMVNGDTISQFGKNSRYDFIYSELGMIPADANGSILEAHGKTVNAEYISAVNPDIILVFDRAQATGESTGSINNLMNNALVKGTKAGKNGDIYILDPYAWYILPGGIRSTLSMIHDLQQVLS
ncbi:ABC transporter substrate-binding protein [Acholeplasma hippikon]|uniref:Uncharacterized ABC transporter solute-binding protein yclQ n=1 Tax=Acholeplasma hippikon TaxID=264636 RepID=A0A449BI07_9MOLU|nr:ABC transporter substrate-binding protein [Acholeplasma hippikon]VEU82043.1 Uncharacterized ABC transporter solute-binding protein yclQ precursor [Acholeplasma hippikon]